MHRWNKKKGKLFPVRLKEKREGEQDSIEKETSMKQSLVAVDLEKTTSTFDVAVAIALMKRLSATRESTHYQCLFICD